MFINRGPNCAVIKLLVMHASQKNMDPDSGIHDHHATATLKGWLETVLGGQWLVKIGKYSYAAGTATQIYGVMVEDSMVLMFQLLPGAMNIYNDGTCSPVW